MKSINKKIRSIYLLAIMAIISVCLAVFPVFKTETVKAEDAELSMTGAYVEFSKANDANDFALMFQAEITKTFVDSKAGQNVKFGMAIGPTDNVSGVTSYADFVGLGNKVKVLDDLVDINDITFDENETTYAYEAGTYFNKKEAGYEGVSAAQWKDAYTKDLTAIPFYTVEGEAPVLKTSITKNASQVVFDTFMEETALPENSELRTVSDAAFRAITGNTLARGYGSNEQIYLNMDTNQFFTNFFRGAWTYTKFNYLQPWVPSMAYTGGGYSAFALGTDLGRPTYFAGGELFNAYPESGAGSMENCKLSSTIFDNIDQITKLIPGETYRLIYKKADGQYIYNNYIAATQIFGIVTNSLGNAVGSYFYRGQKLYETSGTVIYNFFMYAPSGSNIYMPYSRTSQTATAYNKTNYDGYYVLMSDWVLDGINGMNFNMRTGAGVTARAVAPSTQTVDRATLSAFRAISDYIEKFNTSIKQPAFTGTFDGRGCTIDASFGRGGLFGYIDGGTIKNLNIKADFYYYTGSSTVTYATNSYMEKAATLAEVIKNATIENVSIELVENAPVTFKKGQQYLNGASVVTSTTLPDMNNVPGIVASQVIEKSTLKNVIVKCDSLKDAGNSLQNYRAALNLGSGNTLENVFVVGSSYTNMSIDETEDAYVLTLSAPEGIEPGEYVDDGTIPASYFDMARDMFKYMRNVDVTAKTIKVKFIAEKATKKFATEEDFQEYLNSEAGAEAKATFIDTGKWTTDTEGNLVWKEPVAGDAGITTGQYQIVPHTTLTLAEKPAADKTTNFFGWANFDGYNPSVTYAG